MRRIIEYFVERTFLVNLITGFVVVIGVLMMSQMRRDLIPPVAFKFISVTAAVPGASPLEIEKTVIGPIEEAIKSLSGIKEMNSGSENGYGYIWIEFKSDHLNMSESVEEIRSIVARLQDDFPRGYRYVNVEQEKTDVIDVVDVTLVNVDETNAVHRAWVRKIKEKLLELPHVVRVSDSLKTLQIQVRLKPSLLASYGISPQQARGILAEKLAVFPVGQLTRDGETVAVELPAGETTPAALAKLPLRTSRSGRVVRLGDVAEVKLGLPEAQSVRLRNGETGVTLDIYKDMNGDVITLRDEVKKVIADVQPALPAPLRLDLTGDHPNYIEQQLDYLKEDGIVGLLLVIAVIAALIGWRASAATVFGVPFSYLGTAIVLHHYNIAFDLISVIAIIIIVGILVDDAIIVTEKYMQNLEKGKAPKEAAVDAAHSLMAPVTGTLLTTSIAFAPILFVEGPMQQVMFAIPLVIISALAVSWVECFLILPNHLAHWVRVRPTSNSHWFSRTRRAYERALSKALRYRYLTLAGVIALVVATGFLWQKKITTSYWLSIGAERLEVTAILKTSPSLEATREALAPIEAVFREFPKDQVDFVRTDIGDLWLDGKQRKGYRYAQVRAYLPQSHDHPKALKAELEKKIEEKIKSLKSDQFERLTLETEHSGRQDKEKTNSFTVYLTGGEGDSHSEVELAVRNAVEGAPTPATGPGAGPIKGLTTVNLEEGRMQETWRFIADPSALLGYGVSATDLSSHLRESIGPSNLGETRANGEVIEVVTQVSSGATNGGLPGKSLDELKADSLELLASGSIATDAGMLVPMSYLGKWEKLQSLKSVQRRNGKRSMAIDVKYDPDQVRYEDFHTELKKRIEPVQKQFESQYRISLEFSDKQAAENQKWALKTLLICIALILFVLAIILGSITQPLLVGVAIPFGFMGTVWALYFHGMEMTLMAMIGLLGVAGVAVNDSLVMVDSMNELKKENGTNRLDRMMIIQGASSRLRAICATSLTTLVGVFPMAYGIGGETGFTQPLAFSMGWGLACATLLTLFVLPVLMEVREDFARVGAWAWGKLPVARKAAASFTIPQAHAPVPAPAANPGLLVAKDPMMLPPEQRGPGSELTH